MEELLNDSKIIRNRNPIMHKLKDENGEEIKLVVISTLKECSKL